MDIYLRTYLDVFWVGSEYFQILKPQQGGEGNGVAEHWGGLLWEAVELPSLFLETG